MPPKRTAFQVDEKVALRVQQLMDVNYLLHLPEELVEDSADDVHDRLVQLYSPVEDQESEEEGVEELPRVQPR
ncbi:hypothetical protein K3495_g5968 [Podosphaera aphanis]|nr:hypothetical protein K3495_g5968 [Podosphaera aphanis]